MGADQYVVNENLAIVQLSTQNWPCIMEHLTTAITGQQQNGSLENYVPVVLDAVLHWKNRSPAKFDTGTAPDTKPALPVQCTVVVHCANGQFFL